MLTFFLVKTNRIKNSVKPKIHSETTISKTTNYTKSTNQWLFSPITLNFFIHTCKKKSVVKTLLCKPFTKEGTSPHMSSDQKKSPKQTGTDPAEKT